MGKMVIKENRSAVEPSDIYILFSGEFRVEAVGEMHGQKARY